MSLLSRIGKSLGKIGDSISKAYKSVDKAVGGYLPGGVSPSSSKSSSSSGSSSSSKSTSSSSSSSKSSSSSSSSRSSGSSGSSSIFKTSPTYDTATQTYTDSSGNKMSMSLSNALKSGATLINSRTGSSSSGSSSSGSSAASSGMVIDSRTGKPYGTVTAYQRPKGGFLGELTKLEPLSQKISSQRELIRTEKYRSKTGNTSALKELELLGLAAAQTGVNFLRDFVDTPETAYKILRNPSVLKNLPSELEKSGAEFGEVLRVSPGEGIVRVGTEILLLKGTGTALNKLSRASTKTITKLNPRYVGEAKVGKTLKIKTGGGKTVNLKVVGKIPKETLKSQISKAGRKLNAISSQADELLSSIKGILKGKTIRKPIPNEASLSTATKKLLKQFDEGTITSKNLVKLNDALKKQGVKGLLERSFFADPTGKIRPSRLGVTKTGKSSILDYFTEDITFKKAKPQILLFEDVKVSSLPKALKSVGNKLKRGAALTKKEADALLKFQLKKSGKFKPIGFISGESEITLAPGEILKRVKKVGVTIAEGKRIPIVKAEVFKPTGKIKTLLTKFRKGEITKAQTKTLDSMLKKATGFNYGLSSAKKVAGKYVDIKKIGAAALSKLSGKKTTVTSKTIAPTYVKPKKTTPKKPTSPGKTTTKTTSKTTTKKKSGGKSKTPSKAKTPTKKVSNPVSPKKTTKKKLTSSQLAASRRRKKKSTMSSRKPASSRRKSAYGGSSKKTVSYSPKSPGRSPKSPTSSKKGYSGKSPRSPKSPKSPYSPKSPSKGYKKPAAAKSIKTSTTKKRKVSRKPKIGYAVYEKRAGKFVKLKGLPLTKSQAKDRLAYRLDNKISRTAKIVPIKKVKKLGSLPKSQKGYFNKYKSNLRNYKVVRGKKVKTPLTFIEKKGKGVINTLGEKRQLALNRRAKARSSRKITRPKTTVRRTVSRNRPTTKRTSIRRTVKRTVAQSRARSPVKRTVRRTSRRQTPVKRSAQKVARTRKTASKTKPTKRSTPKSTKRRKSSNWWDGYW